MAHDQSLLKRLEDVPAVKLYKFLWKEQKSLLVSTILVTYALPFLMDILPWYFSRRKLSSQLRDLRTQIHHTLYGSTSRNSSKNGSSVIILQYFGFTFMYSILVNVDIYLTNRIVKKKTKINLRFQMTYDSSVGCKESTNFETFTGTKVAFC